MIELDVAYTAAGPSQRAAWVGIVVLVVFGILLAFALAFWLRDVVGRLAEIIWRAAPGLVIALGIAGPLLLLFAFIFANAALGWTGACVTAAWLAAAACASSYDGPSGI
jgi:hypothetical protein